MNYEKVPNIITGKDLDYLSDMFNWNYGALKSNLNALNQVEDNEIKEIIERSTNIFKDNIMNILTILASGGANE
jgi:hypothetical protein